MAGQGTVALEAITQIREQHGADVGTVVLPVGGGGLLGGCGTWLREREPSIRIVGVEPAGAVSMAAALRAGSPVTLHDLDRFVDGASVRRVGSRTLRAAQAIGPAMLAIEEGAVCTEMLALYQTDGIIAEPAGALATTAIASGAIDTTEYGQIVCIVSGGNNDVSRYAEIVERAAIHQGLRHYFLVTFPQEPGALRTFLEQTLTGDEDIIHFEYTKKNNRESGPALVGIDLAHAEDLADFEERMERSPLRIERLRPGTGILEMLL
jgi:threonine dehydratase